MRRVSIDNATRSNPPRIYLSSLAEELTASAPDTIPTTSPSQIVNACDHIRHEGCTYRQGNTQDFANLVALPLEIRHLFHRSRAAGETDAGRQRTAGFLCARVACASSSDCDDDGGEKGAVSRVGVRQDWRNPGCALTTGVGFTCGTGLFDTEGPESGEAVAAVSLLSARRCAQSASPRCNAPWLSPHHKTINRHPRLRLLRIHQHRRCALRASAGG
jgi:hypothetical protein